jgi:hypothetical protein
MLFKKLCRFSPASLKTLNGWEPSIAVYPYIFNSMKGYFILLLLISTVVMAQNTPDSKKIKFLALGDSYTIGESVAEDQRWPVQLVTALKDKGHETTPPQIIATTGWRTDDLKKSHSCCPATERSYTGFTADRSEQSISGKIGRELCSGIRRAFEDGHRLCRR